MLNYAIYIIELLNKTIKSLNNKDDNIHKSEALKQYDNRTLTLVECHNFLGPSIYLRYISHAYNMDEQSTGQKNLLVNALCPMACYLRCYICNIFELRYLWILSSLLYIYF